MVTNLKPASRGTSGDLCPAMTRGALALNDSSCPAQTGYRAVCVCPVPGHSPGWTRGGSGLRYWRCKLQRDTVQRRWQRRQSERSPARLCWVQSYRKLALHSGTENNPLRVCKEDYPHNKNSYFFSSLSLICWPRIFSVVFTSCCDIWQQYTLDLHQTPFLLWTKELRHVTPAWSLSTNQRRLGFHYGSQDCRIGLTPHTRKHVQSHKHPQGKVSPSGISEDAFLLIQREALCRYSALIFQ